MAYAEGVTECPICGSAVTEWFTTQVASEPDRDPKPEGVECTGEAHHRFPVLSVGRTADGQRTYTLVPPETRD